MRFHANVQRFTKMCTNKIADGVSSLDGIYFAIFGYSLLATLAHK